MPIKTELIKRLLWILILLLVFNGCRTVGYPVNDQLLSVETRVTRKPNSLPSAAVTNEPTITLGAPTETARASPSRTATPETAFETSTPTVTIAPTITPTLSFPIYQGPPLKREDLGVQVHIHHENIPDLIDHLDRLGVGWVKVQVSWKLYQPDLDRFDWERFSELDSLIDGAQDREIDVLINVAKAPEWSRPVTELDGPPIDYALYEDFMSFLAERYNGRVAAYELWNEPNLQREWNGAALSAADFVKLIESGTAGVRAEDSQAVVISGAPAVTGINDGIAAIDDRIFMRSMLELGIGSVVDAIGVHPYGWANPPDSTMENPAPFTQSHNNHPSFFFLDTLSDYLALLGENGVEKQLWATEFGWGSFDRILNKQGTPEPAPANAPFMNHVSEIQQAEYILRAFQIAQEMEGIGPMILWNLNFGPLLGTQFSESGYSLLGTDGSPRPSYLSLQNADKE